MRVSAADSIRPAVGVFVEIANVDIIVREVLP